MVSLVTWVEHAPYRLSGSPICRYASNRSVCTSDTSSRDNLSLDHSGSITITFHGKKKERFTYSSTLTVNKTTLLSLWLHCLSLSGYTVSLSLATLSLSLSGYTVSLSGYTVSLSLSLATLSLCLSLWLHCLSLWLYCLSLWLHCLSLWLYCLSLWLHCLSLSFWLHWCVGSL